MNINELRSFVMNPVTSKSITQEMLDGIGAILKKPLDDILISKENELLTKKAEIEATLAKISELKAK